MALFLSNRDGGKTDEEGHYRFQTNVWNGEVANGLNVAQNSPLGMSVIINEGDAKVPYSDYAYTVWSTGDTASITTADPSNPRIDRIVLYVDRSETPQTANPNNPGIPKIAVVAGTPGSSPSRPSDGTVDTAVSNNPWIDLADVLVGTGVTQITNANITDTRELIEVPALSVPSDALQDNSVNSEKLAVALENATPGSVGDVGTSNETLATLDVPAGTWFIFAKGNTQVSVAQQTQATVELYNSTDGAVIDTTIAGSDYVSGTDESRIPFSVADITTITSTKTIIARARVNSGSGSFGIYNVKLFAVPVGV